MRNSNMIAEDHWTKDSTADWATVPVEIGNGALVEVTVWVDGHKKADWTKPKAVMYKGVQVNELVCDSDWVIIEQEVEDYLGSGWF